MWQLPIGVRLSKGTMNSSEEDAPTTRRGLGEGLNISEHGDDTSTLRRSLTSDTIKRLLGLCPHMARLRYPKARLIDALISKNVPLPSWYEASNLLSPVICVCISYFVIVMTHFSVTNVAALSSRYCNSYYVRNFQFSTFPNPVWSYWFSDTIGE